MTRNERWILSEWLVACDRTVIYGEQLLKHREKTPFAEVDLLTRDGAGGLKLIEVKTVNREFWGERFLITPTQVGRLRRARTWFEECYQLPVTLLLAVVSHELQDDFKKPYRTPFLPRVQYFEAGFDWLLT